MRKTRVAAMFTLMACIGFAPIAVAQQPDETASTETPWPHAIQSGDTSILIYQPQLEDRDGYKLDASAAVSVSEGKDDPNPTFGVVRFDARTLVDKQSRLVTIDHLKVEKADFPSAPAQVERDGSWQSSRDMSQTRQQLDRDMSARYQGADRYAGRMQTNRSMSRGGFRRR
jgi:hypothetical protein